MQPAQAQMGPFWSQIWVGRAEPATLRRPAGRTGYHGPLLPRSSPPPRRPPDHAGPQQTELTWAGRRTPRHRTAEENQPDHQLRAAPPPAAAEGAARGQRRPRPSPPGPATASSRRNHHLVARRVAAARRARTPSPWLPTPLLCPGPVDVPANARRERRRGAPAAAGAGRASLSRALLAAQDLGFPLSPRGGDEGGRGSTLHCLTLLHTDRLNLELTAVRV